ncbi:hypothetical protein JDV02_005662 [Purpureocillium takamizusanense]|uniref:Uncharacterized protein n=1 Tax=Purpureocillium takamizusanense TaxID=2060973 RepID=A0A9Q8QGZ8_9HYPO|nr:uncharacterized protein JDV02_005662 [Purpureocillium takamizusanense]UNI19480.1 hypothetical protein JDV02_005662 [Purpureocillium takamizusanense]
MRRVGLFIFVAATASALAPYRTIGLLDDHDGHTVYSTLGITTPTSSSRSSSSPEIATPTAAVERGEDAAAPVQFNDTDFSQDSVHSREFVHSSKPDDYKDFKVDCGHKLHNYVVRGYYEARDRFKKLGGKPNMKAGPDACGQISCSYSTAVKLCNDNTEPKSLDSWKPIAEILEEIHERCNHGEAREFQGGELFHPEHWRVIMERGEC